MGRDTELETLLTHADWLQRLAVHLVHGDRQLAGDVVQQTWLAALRSPPDPNRPARPWLGQVLRNFVRKSGRDAAARRTRETTSAGRGDGECPSAEALLQAAQTQRLIAELVVNLEEPYRSATLARYYQGLEPTEIARRLGIPPGTVRWRLNEAIRRLRADLDGREAAGGPGWRLALLPLFGGPPTRGGLVVMGIKAKVAAVSVIVIGTVVGAGVWRSRTGDPTRQARANLPVPPATAALSLAGAARGGAGPAGAGPAPDVRSGTRRLPPPKLVPAAALDAPPPGAPATAPKRGTVDKGQLRAATRAAMPEIEECYQKLLASDPNASGRLVIRFTIAQDTGQVSEATIVPQKADGGAPQIDAPLAEQCILNALARAPFPVPHDGPVTVTQQMVFAPSNDPAAVQRAGGVVRWKDGHPYVPSEVTPEQ
jgi:RNA polymerase sigma factor (sigma-70 family)